MEVTEASSRSAVPVVLPRAQLVRRVLDTPPGGVCLRTGLGGCGSSTLLRLAASSSDVPAVLVSAAGALASPNRFWPALARALEAVGVALDPPPLEAAAGDDAAAAVLDGLVHGPALRIIIDDLDARRHAKVLDGLATLAEGLPPTATMVLAVRGFAPARFARLAASGRLVRLGTTDLRVPDDEAEALLTSVAPQLPAEQRQALVAAADGWLAALLLPLGAVDERSGQSPVEWLRGEGLCVISDPVLDEGLDLLVQCSVLPELALEACEAVTGGRVADRLARLASWDGVLRRPDPARPRYTTHLLVGEALRRRLADRGEAAERAAHAAAADYAFSCGDVEQAMDHLIDAGRVEDALALLEPNVARLLDTGHADRVGRWYGTMGAQAAGHLLHLLGFGWSQVMVGRVEQAEGAAAELVDAARTIRADQGHEPAPGEGGTLGTLGWLVAGTAHLQAELAGWRGSPAHMQRHAEEAMRLYGTAWSRTGEQTAVLVAARARLWRGDTLGARRTLTIAQGRPRLHELMRRLGYGSAYALLAAQEGRAFRARRLADEVLDYAATAGTYGPSERWDARLALGLAYHDINAVDAALAEADTLVTEADAMDHVSYSVLARVLLAACRWAHGEHRGAIEAIGQARDLVRVRAAGSQLLVPIAAQEARLRLNGRDVVRADRLLRQLPHTVTRQLLQVRLAQMRRPGSGLPDLNAMRPTSPREADEIQLLMARGLAPTRPQEAETHLLAAADQAEEVGLYRLLAGSDPALVSFAERVNRRTSHDGLARLLDVFQEGQARADVAPIQTRLSRGELELLALLPQRPTNQQLAAELSVSVNTVKTRLRRLYRKLDVGGRTEAIQRADRLGLGSSPHRAGRQGNQRSDIPRP